MFDFAKVKEGLGLSEDIKIVINKNDHGFSIKIQNRSHSIGRKIGRQNKNQGKKVIVKTFHEILVDQGLYQPDICYKCKAHCTCEAHHIVPRSAGGKDDPDNGVWLCNRCHVGDGGIHLGKWKIEEIIEEIHLHELKIRYGVIRDEKKNQLSSTTVY